MEENTLDLYTLKSLINGEYASTNNYNLELKAANLYRALIMD